MNGFIMIQPGHLSHPVFRRTTSRFEAVMVS